MPEFWPVFEHHDAEIIGDEYLDLAIFIGDPFDHLLRQAGFKPVTDHVGLTAEMNDILNENMPADMRQPWTEEMMNWAAPEVGRAMWTTLRRATEEKPDLFQLWPDMIEHVSDTLEIADLVFERAVQHQARWFIPSPGF